MTKQKWELLYNSQNGNFIFVGKVQGVFRLFENDYVRIVNFGSYISVTGG